MYWFLGTARNKVLKSFAEDLDPLGGTQNPYCALVSFFQCLVNLPGMT